MTNVKEKVQITALQLEDVSALAVLANNQKIWRNLTDLFPYPNSEKDARWFIENALTQTTHQYITAIRYEGIFCGVISCILLGDIYRKTAKMGYWIGEPFWGKGIATQAVTHMTKQAFQKLPIVRIQAGVFEHNEASMRVLEKNGYHKEGILKKVLFKEEQIWDEHLYAITQP
ncbi:MAG: GNAT family N-acetyltransferase [Thermonemataceae bacterium]